MPSHDPTPRSGVTPVRVRYAECDPMGVAHHASYATWLELARTELLRAQGLSYAQLETRGVLLVVVKLSIQYKRPVRYDDLVEVACSIRGGGRVKIEHEYELCVIEQSAHGPAGEVRTGAVVASAHTLLACVDRAGKLRELPEWLIMR
jgi:acyl-CoA thioester hydrolase